MPIRVLLEECVPRQLKRDLAEFEVRTVGDLRWSGIKNGALILRASAEFDVIFTVDRDFGRTAPAPPPVGIVIVEIGATDAELLRNHLDAIQEALRTTTRGEVRRIRAD